MKLGFVINPYAGIAGSLALKGSDGSEIREKALRAGAEKKALVRAETFLRFISPHKNNLEFYTYGGDMGESSLKKMALPFNVLGRPDAPETSAYDTTQAISLMKEAGVDCIVFLGGDGTARDVCSVLGDAIPVVGVPAGVKMHSAVYAKTPTDAAELILSLLSSSSPLFKLGEVMDIDEAQFRQGRLSANLYGYMKIPVARHMQGKKSVNLGEQDALYGAAKFVAREMEGGKDVFYVVGPGTSTRCIFDLLGLEKTLLGVDVLFEGRLIKKDAAAADLKTLLKGEEGRKYKIVVTTIGGQGCLFGRGNQQIDPDILRGLSKNDIIIVATPEKLLSIPGALYNDTGDPELDRFLSGYYRIRTGDRVEAVFLCK
ncbi:ATP-NAD kinase [Synergistales bacterium]|nr:ATP-NAD kinase [Synergistales bacterium]